MMTRVHPGTLGLQAILIGAALASSVGLTPASAQTVHRLPATPATVVYGYYWSEATPVLRIQSGDIVELETMLTNSPRGLERAGVPPEKIQQALRDIVDQVTDRGPGGHILTGPIYVEGAVPGDAIEVRFLEIGMPLDYGYNGCSGFLSQNCASEGRTRIITLDRERMIAPFGPGIEIPLAPFFGSVGVAPPAEFGRWSSNPPWIHAGNLDNPELVAGTSLFIPVHVPGALLQLGDGHAAQGDGEVDQTGIETSLTGRIEVILHKGMELAWPRGETPTHWIAMGTDEDLTVATEYAVQEAVDFLVSEHGLSQMDAYRLVSLACDVRITQLVDGKRGVHVMIPKSIFVGRGA